MTTQTKVPQGVSGKQREKFLSLATGQREIYRYHFDVCGRFAEHCYLIATLPTLYAEWKRASDRQRREPCDIHLQLEEARWEDYSRAKVRLGLCGTPGCDEPSPAFTMCEDHI